MQRMYVKENNRLTDVLVASVVISSLALRNYTYLLYVLQFLMFALCGKQLLGRVHKAYFFTSVFLVLWAAASCLWAKDESVILHRLIALAQVNVICIFFSGYVTSKEAIENMITFFVLAGVVLIVNLLFSTSISEWKEILFFSRGANVNISSSEGRVGPAVGMHPNEFAGVAEITLLCAWHRLCTTKRKRYAAICAGVGIVLLLSKSRSSIVFVALGTMIYYVFSAKSSSVQFRRIMIGIALGVAGLIAIFKIPVLYSLVGYRMQGIVDGLIGNKADASTSARMDMILIGMDIFSKHIFTGIGLNNYSVEAYKNYGIWGQVYAHNNYVELLSCLGLIGFLLYYGIKMGCMVRLMKYPLRRRKTLPEDTSLLVFFKCMLIVFLVEEMAKVTYFSEPYQFFYLLIIAGTSVLMGKRTPHNHEPAAE